MNFYSLWLLLLGMLTSAPQEQHHFVSLEESAIRIVKEKEGWRAGIPFLIQEPFHIQDISGEQEHVIPTTISFESSELFEIVQYEFGALKYDTVYLDQVPSKVLSGSFEVRVFIKSLAEPSESPLLLKGELVYQACNDRQCFFPRTLTFIIPLRH